MDIYCGTCREPWDNDSLHDEAKESGRTYAAVAADFRARGCKALEAGFGPQSSCVQPPAGRSATVDTVYELMGDDMDGAACMFEDAESMGLFD